jgi:hypothetical protein
MLSKGSSWIKLIGANSIKKSSTLFPECFPVQDAGVSGSPNHLRESNYLLARDIEWN